MLDFRNYYCTVNKDGTYKLNALVTSYDYDKDKKKLVCSLCNDIQDISEHVYEIEVTIDHSTDNVFEITKHSLPFEPPCHTNLQSMYSDLSDSTDIESMSDGKYLMHVFWNYYRSDPYAEEYSYDCDILWYKEIVFVTCTRCKDEFREYEITVGIIYAHKVLDTRFHLCKKCFKELQTF